MRDYGKVHTTFWSSATIRDLSEDGRALALYLLTSPHGTIAGAFRLPDGYACEDLQWDPERVVEGFRELFAKGFANRCETTKWVWIRKHFDWNRPENPNQRKAAAKVAVSIPDECDWKLEFMRGCGDFLGLDGTQIANPSETLPKPFANQEQEQEQEQKKELKPRSPSGSRLPEDWSLPADWLVWGKSERPEIDIEAEAEKFRDFWHAKAGKDARKANWLATWRNWVRNAHAPAKVNGRPVATGYRPLPGEI